MNKNNFLFGRLGNKQNDIKYFKDMLPMEVKNVIEPFGGSFAVCRCIYQDDKYNKFVNDNDPALWEIYNNPEGYDQLKKKLNNIAGLCLYPDTKDKVDYKKWKEMVNNDKTINKESNFYIQWINENINRGVNIKYQKEMNTDEAVKLMKKITFSNVDYMEIINKYKNNKDSFIFIDPPYMFSDNTSYAQQQRKSGEDMTDILVNIYSILKDKKTKAKIMLVINDLKILRWLFADFLKNSYDKIYSIGKRRDKILVITNF